MSAEPGGPRVRVLINPTAGGGRAHRLMPRLSACAASFGAECIVTRSAEQLHAEAARAVRDGAERIVVVGGDGSIHRTLEPLAGSGTALGLVPLGSGNDLAGALRITGDPLSCLRSAIGGPLRRIDLGRVAGRAFVGTGGVGFDGEVARRVRERRGVVPRPLVYPAAVIAALSSYRAPEVTLEHDAGTFRGRVLFVVLANSPRFGGGMRVAPDARIDDGRLDVVIVRETGRLELLAALPRVYRGTHLTHPKVESFRTTRARLFCERPITVYGDGEPIVEVGDSGVEFAVDPGALAVAAVRP